MKLNLLRNKSMFTRDEIVSNWEVLLYHGRDFKLWLKPRKGKLHSDDGCLPINFSSTFRTTKFVFFGGVILEF